MKATNQLKPTKSQKRALARSMSEAAWIDLCGFVKFIDALESNFELAALIADDYARNGRGCDSLKG